MREIKFRAWDVRRSIMVIDALELSERNQLVTVNEEHFNYPFSFFDGCFWMQYTGISQDHGSGRFYVYDGDIVELDMSEISGKKEDVITGEVQWNNDPTLDLQCWGIWTKKGWYSTDFMGRLKILGNIYENPEMAKQYGG